MKRLTELTEWKSYLYILSIHHVKQTALSWHWTLFWESWCVYLLTVKLSCVYVNTNLGWWRCKIRAYWKTLKWNWNLLSLNFLPSLCLLHCCPSRIEFLRHIRDFFQIMFKIEVQKPSEDERKGGDKVLMTCVGVGYSNINKTLK